MARPGGVDNRERVDMQQSTDPDATGAGREPTGAEAPDAHTALSAYLGHRPACIDCTAARRCETASGLWAAYKAATGTS